MEFLLGLAFGGLAVWLYLKWKNKDNSSDFTGGGGSLVDQEQSKDHK